MIKVWWDGVGGRLGHNYPLVEGTRGGRQVDALVRRDLPREWINRKDWRTFGEVAGSDDVVLVQAKTSPLCLPLLGQAFFSRELARDHLRVNPRSTLALCRKTDADAEALAHEYDVEVVELWRPEWGRGSSFGLQPRQDVIARGWAKIADRRHHLAWDVQLTPRRKGSVSHRAHAVGFLDGEWKQGQTLDNRDLVLLSDGGQHHGFGMYVLGQAFFGAELLRRRPNERPLRVQTAVVVPSGEMDTVMQALACRHGIKVIEVD